MSVFPLVKACENCSLLVKLQPPRAIEALNKRMKHGVIAWTGVFSEKQSSTLFFPVQHQCAFPPEAGDLICVFMDRVQTQHVEL